VKNVMGQAGQPMDCPASVAKEPDIMKGIIYETRT